MLDTRVSSRHCACYMTSSCDQEWPLRCRRQLAAASDASNMKSIMPKPQCNPSLLMHLYSCYILTLQVLRQWWSWINPKMWWTLWSFATTLWNMLWHTWPLTKLQKLLLSFLWQGYISIFGAPARLLSDKGANFESNIIRELCKLMHIQKVRTSPYHAQTNRQVELAHQTLMHMIGKLSRDQKADWLRLLPKVMHAHNSTRLAITRYSPHYLMHVHWLCLLIDFYLPTLRGTRKHQCVDYYVTELHEWLWEAFKEAQVQSMSEVTLW